MAYTVTYKRRTKTGKVTTVRRRVQGSGGPRNPRIPAAPESKMVRKKYRAASRELTRITNIADRAIKEATPPARRLKANVKRMWNMYTHAPGKRHGVQITGQTQRGSYHSAGGATFKRVPSGMRLSTRIERTGPFGIARQSTTRIVKSIPKR